MAKIFFYQAFYTELESDNGKTPMGRFFKMPVRNMIRQQFLKNEFIVSDVKEKIVIQLKGFYSIDGKKEQDISNSDVLFGVIGKPTKTLSTIRDENTSMAFS